MAYVFLLGAIAAEVLATSLLRSTEGFSRVWPTLACLSAYAVSFGLLSRAVRTVPVGVLYALWSGLGTIAIVAIGVVFLDEGLTGIKAAGIALVITGVILLNLGSAG